MNILGYSERGVLNALFYDIAGAASPASTLAALLAEATFPFASLPTTIADNAEVLIEQSFSDFGDADALLLIEGEAGQRAAVFIEAKVKTSQRAPWQIAEEFDRFTRGLEPDETVDSSNLFTQVYHKQRMVEELDACGLAGLIAGIRFSDCSSKRLRKIGGNPVVRHAVERLAHALEQTEALYLPYVTGSPEKASSRRTLLRAEPGYWDMHPQYKRVYRAKET